jgi:HEPN domain-containing protein
VRWDTVVLWLSRATADLLAARAILAVVMPSYETAAFHTQQAAEKALKALLVRHQIPFGKTHNITELLVLGEPVATGISAELADASALTPYAIDARYPTEVPAPDKDETSRALAVATRVVDRVRALLASYLDAGRPTG